MLRRTSTNRIRGLTALSVAGTIILLGVIMTGAWTLRNTTSNRSPESDVDLFRVRKGSFEIIIPASGELAAEKQIEIKNKLESRSVITELLDEGAIAREGDVLVRFNDEEIRTRLRDADEAVISAQNDLNSAVAELEIVKKTRESEIEKARLRVELTELELKGWKQGEVVTKRQDLKLALETAQLNHNRLKDRFEASKGLYEQEFISLDEFKQDEIALVEAKARLKQASLDIEVYENFTFIKERKQKESDYEQSGKELSRVIARQNASISRAESDLFSKQRRLKSKEERRDKHQEQLDFCTLTAPQDGLVVYSSSLDAFRWMRRNGNSIQVGTELWHNQLIMILPDTSSMMAEVKINEALSGLIEPGQRVTLSCDAKPDVILTGRVESIGVLAESGDWSDPNRREYTVRIKLDGSNELELKPSMRCKADIKIDQVDDALHIPIQAVHRKGPLTFVYVPDGSGFSQHEVTLGRSSDLYIEITEGLSEDDQVLLRDPEIKEIVTKLPPAPEPVLETTTDEEDQPVESDMPEPPAEKPEETN